MKLKCIFSFAVLAALLFSVQVSGQNPVNPASVNVNELSDSQIDRIIQEMQTRGLTEDQAIAMAKAQGASQTQIDQLTIRIQQRQTGQGNEANTTNTSTPKDRSHKTSDSLRES